MPIYEFEKKAPRIAPTSYVHPQAVLIGDVEIEAHCYIGPGAVLRADFGSIKLGARSSVQDNAVLHADHGKPISIQKNVIVGHNATLHGTTIGSFVLVGMGAILLDGVSCGNDVLIAAGALIKEGFQIPSNVMIAGNPARIIRPLSGAQKKGIHDGVKTYQDLVKRCRIGCRQIPRE
jgi:phenylacetic acid degradation protein